LIKAQRLEQRAEKYLIQRRQRRIKVEKEFYDSISHEAGQRLHEADVNLGIARALRRLAGTVVERMRGHVDSDDLDGSEIDFSMDASDLNSEVDA